MKSCCKETYKNILKEVLIFVDKNKITELSTLVHVLLETIDVLNRQKEKENESNNK